MIELHYVHTPNVRKVRMMLIETGLPYDCVFYDIRAGDHLSRDFGRLNPNHKLPTIRDLDPADGGAPVTIFESGAILIYLAEKTGRFLSTNARSRTKTLQWLMWQMAGLGPMAGQAGHFHIYAPEPVPYAIERYDREMQRLLNVMDTRLGQSGYLADQYSIADIACWPVINTFQRLTPITPFANVVRWHDLIGERPAARECLSESGIPQRLLENPVQMTPSEWSNLHGENLLEAVKSRA